MSRMDTREMPHNLEAERSFLGAVFLDNRAVVDHDDLEPDEFYSNAHRLTWRAMLDLNSQGSAIDVITLADLLNKRNQLDAVGGPNRLAQLSSEVPSAANIGYYKAIVRRKASLRDFIRKSLALVDEAYGDVDDYYDFVDRTQKMPLATFKVGSGPDYHVTKSTVKEVMGGIDDLYRRLKEGGEAAGLPIGIRQMSEILHGWRPSDLVVIGARPAMGKTALAHQLVCELALEHGIPVGFFSLEMTRAQLVTRQMCGMAAADSTKLRAGRMSEQEWSRFLKAAGELSDAPVFHDDTPQLTLSEFRRKARRMVQEEGVRVIAIDYLQLMRYRGENKTHTKSEELEEITRGVKGVAKELNITVIALAQLNRNLETRTDKRPQTADLRGSGAIEQDADIIAFLYRDEVYDPQTEDKGIAELGVVKHRDGGLGVARMKFVGHLTKFEDLPEDSEKYRFD